MGQYNALNIAWNALFGHKNWQRAWRDPEPKSNYDVVAAMALPRPII